jgi:hypothetical protein
LRMNSASIHVRFWGKSGHQFRRFATSNQSGVMLSSLMILPHFSASARVNFAS